MTSHLKDMSSRQLTEGTQTAACAAYWGCQRDKDVPSECDYSAWSIEKLQPVCHYTCILGAAFGILNTISHPMGIQPLNSPPEFCMLSSSVLCVFVVM